MNEETLEPFGFDTNNDRWLDHLRRARKAEPLGRVGPFELIEEVHRGGQGIVFRARRQNGATDFAIKRLAGGIFAAPESKKRFAREIEAVQALDHPAIVKIQGVEVVDGQTVLVMDWIDGLPFREWVDRRRSTEKRIHRRNLHALIEVFITLCDAIHHAHQRGIIHRDLKSSNILVDENGRIHVLDFGLAKFEAEPLEPALTHTMGFLGTPAYASPEQLFGNSKHADVRSDVYSLGVLLYELVAGALPYPESSSSSMAHLIDSLRSAEPDPPSKGAQIRDPDLDVIILKALAREPERRYPSVDSLKSDLRRYLDGEAIEARGPSSWYQFQKLVKRHRWPFAMALTFLVFSTMFGLYATRTAKDLKAQRDQATSSRLRAVDEAAKAAAIQDFLFNDVLLPSDPYMNGLATSLGDVLSAASQKMDHGLDGQPAVASQMHHLLGRTYQRMGQLEPALHHAQKCLSIRLSTVPGERELLEARLFLGEVLQEMMALDRAEDVLGLLPLDDEDWCRSFAEESRQARFLRSSVALARGHFDSAETDIREALDMRDWAPPATDDWMSSAETQLAYVLLERHRSDEARPLIEKSLAFTREHAETNQTNLANLLLLKGRLCAVEGDILSATELFREGLDVCALRFGETSSKQEPVTRGLLLTELGFMKGLSSDYEGAEKSLASALAFFEGRGQKETHFYALPLRALADVRIAQSRYQEAEGLCREALRLYGKSGRHDHSRTTRFLLGISLGKQGQHQEARTIFYEALEEAERLFGSEHPQAAIVLGQLAMSHADDGDRNEAIELYQRAVRMEPPNPPLSGSHYRELGLLLHQEGRVSEAIESLKKSIDSFERCHIPQCEKVARNRLDLGRWLTIQEHIEEAQLYLEDALEDLEAFPHLVATRADAGFLLARCLRQEGDFEGAEDLLTFHYDEVVAQVGPAYKDAARDLCLELVALYTVWGNHESDLEHWKRLAESDQP